MTKKILIVDDDPEMRLALRIRLKAAKYEVFSAEDGVSAVVEARKQTPDLILLDLGLPAGDGFVVLERLKASDALARTPVIVVSGRDRSSNDQRARLAGAARFFQKPVRHTELLSAVDTLLNGDAEPAMRVYNLRAGTA